MLYQRNNNIVLKDHILYKKIHGTNPNEKPKVVDLPQDQKSLTMSTKDGDILKTIHHKQLAI